jgi:energy-converting hydrogenase A subunit M
MERIKVGGKKNKQTLDLKICFCSYFVHDSSKEAAELAKKKVQS